MLSTDEIEALRLIVVEQKASSGQMLDGGAQDVLCSSECCMHSPPLPCLPGEMQLLHTLVTMADTGGGWQMEAAAPGRSEEQLQVIHEDDIDFAHEA